MKFETCVKLQSQRVQDGEWPLEKKLFTAFADLKKEIKYISTLGRHTVWIFKRSLHFHLPRKNYKPITLKQDLI